MTNLEVIQTALRRVGLNSNASTFKDGARTYLNMVGKDIQSREKSGIGCLSRRRLIRSPAPRPTASRPTR